MKIIFTLSLLLLCASAPYHPLTAVLSAGSHTVSLILYASANTCGIAATGEGLYWIEELK